MRIAYLVALVTVANVLSAPNVYAGNTSLTVQIGAKIHRPPNSELVVRTTNADLVAVWCVTTRQKLTQGSTTNTSNNSPVNSLSCLNGSCP